MAQTNSKTPAYLQRYRKKVPGKKDWRDSPYAKIADGGLRVAKHFVPYGNEAYDLVGLATGFNTEKKCFDLQATATMSAILGATAIQCGPVCLTNIQQGDNGDECSGNSVRVSDFMFRAQIFWPSNNYQSHRLTIFVDRENNGIAPLISDIFEDVTTPINLLLSPLNRSNFGRFNIIKDHFFDPENVGATANVQRIDWTFGEEKLSDRGEHHLTWDSSDIHTDPGSLRKGHIYYVWLGLQGIYTAALNPTITTAATASPYVRLWARTRYVDN